MYLLGLTRHDGYSTRFAFRASFLPLVLLCMGSRSCRSEQNQCHDEIVDDLGRDLNHVHDRHIDHEHVVSHVIIAQIGYDLDNHVAPDVDEAHQGPKNDHANV